MNYLRVRGEYDQRDMDTIEWLELPPRARRIQAAEKNLESVRGTTSACAENTPRRLCLCFFPWNYLRVRGEYYSILIDTWYQSELPPRARRIQGAGLFGQLGKGTTSACAENTLQAFARPR